MFTELPGFTFLASGNVFSAEHKGMRYRLCKVEVGEKEYAVQACVWPSPWCFDKTQEENKTFETFELSEGALPLIKAWLNEQFEKNGEVWSKADTGKLY